MRLSSVYAARAVWYLDIDELNPHGKRLFPEIVSALVRDFDFSIFPETVAQMDPAAKTGIAFKNGKFPAGETGNGLVAWDLEIHAAGIAVETKSSTDASEHILEQAIDWGVKEFGLNFSPTMIRKKAYVSQLVFYPNGDVAKGLQKFKEFTDLLSGMPIGGVIQKRELSSLLFKGDGNDRWSFTFERRADAPFSEKKYFSSCDLPTDDHLSLLGLFEKILLSE